MPKILFVTARIPYPLSHGGALRVFNLSRELGRYNECYLACIGRGEPGALDALLEQGVYKDIHVLPVPRRCSSFKRFFRSSEGDLNRLGRPAYFAYVAGKLQDIVHELEVEVVIAVTLQMAEFVVPLTGVSKIIDDYDCVTLTMEREMSAAKSQASLTRRLMNRLQLARVRRQESGLTQLFDAVTTISPADHEALGILNRQHRESIHVIPNGVDQEKNACTGVAEYENSIAFWGELSFPPNSSAVKYFYREVYLPFLKDKGITWYVVGKNADEEIQNMSRSCKGIIVTGFVQCLNELVCKIPVMVNPMVMGSGLKNKVLEAFNLRRAVVSTSMGVEALTARDGVHYLAADTPGVFADNVIKLLKDRGLREKLGNEAAGLVRSQYCWTQIGLKLNSLICGLK